ncbi:hypothetical protein D3C72_1987100 [compost metagenome]
MRLVQKMSGLHLVVLDHAQQGGAIAAPVGRARRIDDGIVGRRHAVAQYAGNIDIHIGRDGGEDGVRGIVQRVVEVKQPDRRRAVKMGHRHRSLC